MKMHPLGRSGLQVSEICLGSMTWGSQNTEAEAHAQISLAADHGVNIIDTAEMYPTTPMRREHVGLSERMIGTWLRANRQRKMIVATKVVGEGSAMVRDGGDISGRVIRLAVEQSLRNLQTERIDLYQLHWPNRGSYHFRKSWQFDPYRQPKGIDDHVIDVLQTIAALRDEGKIDQFGLSNESAWGVMRLFRCLRRTACRALPRSRTNTACCTASLTSTLPRWRDTRMWDCWPIRRLLPAC